MPRFRPHLPEQDEKERCPVSGKLLFASEREALQEAEWILKQRDTALDVYLCLACDHWHFTSSR